MSLYRVNNVVEINKYISMKSRCPVCAYDMDMLEGDVVFTAAPAGTVYEGLGRQLVESAEAFVKGEGCKAIASDGEHKNMGSQKAHKALGFTETHQDQECVFYYKKLLD